MIRKLALTAAAAIALAAIGFGAYTTFGHKGHAEANRLISCTVAKDETATPPTEEITCNGKIIVITPFGHRQIDFVLVVDAIDHPPSGPSFGDEITSCTLAVGGNPAQPIHVGPCP